MPQVTSVNPQSTIRLVHEVGEPVTAIRLNSEAAIRWLLSDPPDPVRLRQTLDRIVKNSCRAGDLVDRLRVSVERPQRLEEAMDINEIVHAGLARASLHPCCAGAVVQCDLREKMPGIAGGRSALEQVVETLVVRHAMHGRNRRLRIQTRGTGTAIRIVIDGSGSEKSEPAPHTDAANAPGELDLAICRAIVEFHGGYLTVEPMARQVRFAFTLTARGCGGEAQTAKD